MTSKIEEIIDEIEEYIDSCRYQTFSQTNIIVGKDQIEQFLHDLKVNTPEEIKRYQQIISNREAILSDARAKAEKMLSEAKRQTMELVNEHEIMQQAYAKANQVVTMATNQAQEVLDQATTEANAVKSSAMQYTDELLATLEEIITKASTLAQANYSELISNLNSCNGVVKQNRSELSPATDDDLATIAYVTPTDSDGDSSGAGTLDIL